MRVNQPVPNYWPGGCFGCGQANGQGLRLSFWMSGRGCYTRSTIPEHLCGFDGLVHGGIICTLLDEAAAWAIISHLARIGVTTEMSTRYLKPVPTATELLVEGEIVRHDDRSAVVRSTVCSTHGELLAEAQSTWRFLPLEVLAKLTQVEVGTLREFVDRYVQWRAGGPQG